MTKAVTSVSPGAAVAQHPAGVGGVFVSITEVVPGYEREYNRWYEDDHFYLGAMFAPWVVSGRRWVATHAMRQTWLPKNSALAGQGGPGCYLQMYLIVEGHTDEAEDWIMRNWLDVLVPEGRNFSVPAEDGAREVVGRNYVYSTFHNQIFSCRDTDQPLRDIHALNYPFDGLAFDVIRSTRPRAEFEEWLRHRLEAEFEGSNARGERRLAIVVEASRNEGLPSTSAVTSEEAQLGVLWFFDTPPSAGGYVSALPGYHRSIDESATEELILSTTFVPTIPGTDTYVDQLLG